MANPDPSPSTRFKPGDVGNPGGKTKEQKRLEMEAADMALRMRHALLSLMTEKAEAGESIEEYLEPTALKLFKDSEDRAHGTPSQSHVIGGSKDMAPIQTEEVGAAAKLVDMINDIEKRSGTAGEPDAE